MGRVHASLGENAEALEHLALALVIFRKIGDPMEGDVSFEMGHLYEKQAAYPQALESYEAAVLLGEEHASPHLQRIQDRLRDHTSTA